jgi:hypothetical protein
MKRLKETLFLLECHESDMIWHLQHGTEAEFEQSRLARKREFRKLAKLVRFAPIVFL